jgi:flagellar protein FlaI
VIHNRRKKQANTSSYFKIWFAIHSTRPKGPDYKAIRRIRTLTEINPTEDGITSTDLFCYDRKTDSFGLDDIEELVRKSKRLNHVAELLGLEPVIGMQKRIVLLDQCLEKKAYDIPQVFEILKKYYSSVE